MTSALAQTPLHTWHASHGGRMVDFAGWSMPVQYASIVTEHNATRNAVGLFDVSHMGRIGVSGPESERFLDRVVTRRVAGMRPGVVRYSLVTNDAGGILDDILVYRTAYHAAANPTGARAGDDGFLLVVNASNRQKIWDWLHAQPLRDGVSLIDLTVETAMIAVQGPRALEIVRPVSSLDGASLKYYHAAESTILGQRGILSRTGYTGEDGCELILPAGSAPALWEQLISAASAVGGTAAGLGCRDTLRLEAGMPLYGHELSEATHPFQAGLDFAVDLEGRAFPGREALVHLRDDPDQQRRVGWVLAGRRVPREGYVVLSGGVPVGHVTSGTFSPTLDKPIAMGYTHRDFTSPGTAVMVDIRGNQEPARVVSLPFYRRNT